ncbi:sensor histidine kinase [Butyricicoccus sp.]|uniref:sensor histidine kinase n=1 Tax=Butyricicoccus sp. TaxID=2049021 RepID=UPI003F148D90
MIKTLQKKFVVSSMIAITGLIVLLLGAINGVNMVIVQKDISRTLMMISDRESRERERSINPADSPAMERDQTPLPFGNRKSEEDIWMASNFFVVHLDESGEAVYVDVSRTSTITREEAAILAGEIKETSKASGRIRQYRYQITEMRNAQGTLMVFLDTSDEMLSYLRVLLLSASIGIVCWCLMLLSVFLLSKRAIRPIAENMEKQKQFVTNAVHEIKTPLAIIQSNTEAMELYQGENKWSRNIKEQTERLSGLMQHLLLLSRMDEGVEQVHATNICFSDLLKESVQSFMPLMEARHLVVHAHIPPDIQIHADQSQMEQLCSILLDNAVKYTDENGQIQIDLIQQGKHMQCTIQNTCRNLPDVSPDKLFDRFFRSDEARTQKSGGYGIGLSVAKAIVQANQGTIHAAYIKPDAICFTVWI